MSLFFQASIQSPNKSCLETFGDFCLQPVRYLSGENGRLYVIEEATKTVLEDERAFAESSRSWIKTAAAIACVIPALIIGAIAKLLAYAFDGAMKERQQLVVSYLNYKGPYSVTIPEPDPNKDFDSYIVELGECRKALFKKIEEHDLVDYDDVIGNPAKYTERAVAIWEKEEIIDAADQLMECMVRVAKIFKEELQECAKDYSISVEEILVKELSFFGIVKPYHDIRGCTFYSGSCLGSKHAHFGLEIGEGKQNPNAEKPYFQAGTPQRKWRDYYNFVSDLFSDVLPKISDQRFSNWAKRDMCRQSFKARPDGLPS